MYSHYSSTEVLRSRKSIITHNEPVDVSTFRGRSGTSCDGGVCDQQAGRAVGDGHTVFAARILNVAILLDLTQDVVVIAGTRQHLSQ